MSIAFAAQRNTCRAGEPLEGNRILRVTTRTDPGILESLIQSLVHASTPHEITTIMTAHDRFVRDFCRAYLAKHAADSASVRKFDAIYLANLVVSDASSSDLFGLGTILKTTQAFRAISLHDCKIQDPANEFLSNFSDAKWLTKIELHRVGAEIAVPLGALLGDSPWITDVSVALNALGPEGIKPIAEGLAKAASCARLNVHGNALGPAGIETLVSAISKFASSLTVLNVSGNNIGDDGALALAKVITNAPKLVYFDGSLNAITDASALAAALKTCKVLEQIHLDNNLFESATIDDAFQIPTLTCLSLAGNKLETLPAALCKLKLLQSLDVRQNMITELPDDFHYLTRLKYLGVSNNRWVTPPQEVMADNAVVIITNYMKNLEEEGGKRCMQSRLMLVGLGQVGKTSLQKALMSPSGRAEAIAVDQRTVGIDTTYWKPRDDSDFEFRIWDFAGQRVYYQTHQFFLSTRVLYVLVWKMADIRPRKALIEEWLDSLQARVPEASVLIVATHADAIESEEEREKILRNAHSIVDSYVAERNSRGAFRLNLINDGRSLPVSCSSGFGVAEAREAIIDAGMSLRHVEERIPTSWTQLRDSLVGLAHEPPFVDWNQVMSVAPENLRDSDTKLESAVELFHELGDILYFRSGQHRLVFFRPQWIVDVIRAIVRHKIAPELEREYKRSIEMLKRQGTLHRDLMHASLESVASQDHHALLMELLCKFEVAFQLPSDRWLVPALLPAGGWDAVSEESGDWPNWSDGDKGIGHEVTLEFKLIPPGFFQRLCIRAHLLVQGIGHDLEEFHSLFARFRTQQKSRLFLEILETPKQGMQMVQIITRGPESAEIVAGVAKQARKLLEFFLGCVYKVNDAKEKEHAWSQFAVEKFRVTPPTDLEKKKQDDEIYRAESGSLPVMISYKHNKDEEVYVNKIKETLNKHDIGVWIDREGIIGGAAWRAAIASGIKNARAIVFAKSSLSVTSPFCEEEICLARRLGKEILPALVSEQPNIADYLPLMRQYVGEHTQYIDFFHRDFNDAMGELHTLVMTKIKHAEARAKRAEQGERRGRVVLPAFEGTKAGKGLDAYVFLSHDPKDLEYAQSVAKWIEAGTGCKECFVLLHGEAVQSPSRMRDMDMSAAMIPLITRNFTSNFDCWLEISQWSENRKPFLPLFVEDVDIGWEEGGSEMLVSRHEKHGMDLLAIDDTTKGLESFCKILERSLRAAPRDTSARGQSQPRLVHALSKMNMIGPGAKATGGFGAFKAVDDLRADVKQNQANTAETLQAILAAVQNVESLLTAQNERISAVEARLDDIAGKVLAATAPRASIRSISDEEATMASSSAVRPPSGSSKKKPVSADGVAMPGKPAPNMGAAKKKGFFSKRK